VRTLIGCGLVCAGWIGFDNAHSVKPLDSHFKHAGKLRQFGFKSALAYLPQRTPQQTPKKTKARCVKPKYTVQMNSILAVQASPAVHGVVPVFSPKRMSFYLLGEVQAGFPSPAADFAAKRIDLNQELITHPQATFFLRARGTSMIEAGIFDGDTLVVNRALRPKHGHIVVAVVDGEFTVKILHHRADRIKLKPANPTFPDITPREGQTLEIWGVVTATIKQFPA
jgi:DNA polymerase V